MFFYDNAEQKNDVASCNTSKNDFIEVPTNLLDTDLKIILFGQSK